MADNGSYFHDSKTPWIAADVGSVTLSSTAKALYPANSFPPLGSGYFQTFEGKALSIHIFGRITTAATPGNGSFDIYFGTGADANGTILASSAALALTANQTAISWVLDLNVRVRKLNDATSGALLVTGIAQFGVSVLASTLAPVFIPANTAAQTTVDLTTSSIISVQYKRSGSTAETMQIHDMVVSALN
jgi:hypothetical protein